MCLADLVIVFPIMSKVLFLYKINAGYSESIFLLRVVNVEINYTCI